MEFQRYYMSHPAKLSGTKVLPAVHLSCPVGILLKSHTLLSAVALARKKKKKRRENFHSGASQTRALCCGRCPSLGLREFVLSQTITFFSVQTKTLISLRGRAASRLPAGERKKKELPPFIRVIGVVEHFSNVVSLAPFAVKELNYKYRLCKKRHMGQKPRGLWLCFCHWLGNSAWSC